MSALDIRSAQRPDPDQPMVDIANYVADYTIESKEAYDTARYMLLDSLACAMLAMKFPECVKHLGPLVHGAVLPGGARVPGTAWELDPVQDANKAHDIQGCYALMNSFNRVGLDLVILVRLASTAVATQMLGGSKDDIVN